MAGMGRQIVGEGYYCRDKFILEHCYKKRILHVGCTDYPFLSESLEGGYLLHEKLNNIASLLIGIDIAEEDVKELKKLGYDVRLIDAQECSKYSWKSKFDVVLLADVIEHIPNPGLVLLEAKEMLDEDGTILISVPNAFGIVRFLKSFFRYEQVHPDHVAYYSSSTLETLAKNLGLVVDKVAWYRFEVRDKRLIVRLSAAFERILARIFPWQAERFLISLKLGSIES